jgi:hypothetical protein
MFGRKKAHKTQKVKKDFGLRPRSRVFLALYAPFAAEKPFSFFGVVKYARVSEIGNVSH